jgi:hypothetical protein
MVSALRAAVVSEALPWSDLGEAVMFGPELVVGLDVSDEQLLNRAAITAAETAGKSVHRRTSPGGDEILRITGTPLSLIYVGADRASSDECHRVEVPTQSEILRSNEPTGRSLPRRAALRPSARAIGELTFRGPPRCVLADCVDRTTQIFASGGEAILDDLVDSVSFDEMLAFELIETV